VASIRKIPPCPGGGTHRWFLRPDRPQIFDRYRDLGWLRLRLRNLRLGSFAPLGRKAKLKRTHHQKIKEAHQLGSSGPGRRQKHDGGAFMQGVSVAHRSTIRRWAWPRGCEPAQPRKFFARHPSRVDAAPVPDEIPGNELAAKFPENERRPPAPAGSAWSIGPESPLHSCDQINHSHARRQEPSLRVRAERREAPIHGVKRSKKTCQDYYIYWNLTPSGPRWDPYLAT